MYRLAPFGCRTMTLASRVNWTITVQSDMISVSKRFARWRSEECSRFRMCWGENEKSSVPELEVNISSRMWMRPWLEQNCSDQGNTAKLKRSCDSSLFYEELVRLTRAPCSCQDECGETRARMLLLITTVNANGTSNKNARSDKESLAIVLSWLICNSLRNGK
jgi:hypothetical protein